MNPAALDIAAAIAARQTFIVTSHARPDGDAVGSSLALAFALEALGKRARVVLRDPIPVPYRGFPGADRVECVPSVDTPADAAVVLECSDLSRPDVKGLDGYFVINVDHHLGNQMYGGVNWFDSGAAACGEMVADIIDALGVPWSVEMAQHLYLAITTDTGGFRYGPLSARTFEICRRIAETGVNTSELSRQIFDSYSLGRVRLMGALLADMTLHHDGRFAVLTLDDALLARCGAVVDDAEGLVNLPLSAREVSAVALFKHQSGETYRVSLRSKGEVDVRTVAERWQGGGHRNAAGCTMMGSFVEVRAALVAAMTDALDVTPPAAPAAPTAR